MTTSVAYPGARTQPGSPAAKTAAAAAVIALSTAIAGAALVAGIATGSTVEAPDRGASSQSTSTFSDQTPRGGNFSQGG